MFVASRVIILSQDIKFARRLKSGLEESRQAVAQIFTTPQNALSYLKDNPQDVVVIDVSEMHYDAKSIYDTFLMTQPELGFIFLSADDTTILTTSPILKVVPRTTRVRELLPVIHNIADAVNDTLPDTSQMQPVSDDSTRLLNQDAEAPPDEEDTPTSAIETFRRLAAEEPPMPDDATISDLRHEISKTPPAGVPLPSPTDDPDTPRTPATLALQSTNGETTYLDELALQTFMRELEERIADANIDPTTEPGVREPDFLRPHLPDADQPLEYTSGTTTASSDEFDLSPTDFITERQQPQRRSQPIEPEATPDLMPLPPDQDDEPLIITQPLTPATPPVDFEGDTQVLQLASVITQMSLETAASATVLLWRRQIIAQAGEMPRADIEALFEQESRLLEPTDKPEQMIFVTLKTNATDYMVMMMPTIDQLTLILIFSGKQPLNTIRRQTQRLVNALATVPPLEVKPVDAPVPDAEPVDAPVPDAEPVDAPVPDAEPVDAPVPDAEPVDAPVPDAEPVDAPVPDAEPVDAPVPDAEPVDAPVPDAEPVDAPVPDAEPMPSILSSKPRQTQPDKDTHRPYTFLWALKNPDQTFNDEVARALVRGLDMQYSQQGWHIVEIDVHNDHIQLQAQISGDRPPHEHIYELMRFSSDIVRDQMPEGEIWSSSYLILSPARRLEPEEVDDFLKFSRS